MGWRSWLTALFGLTEPRFVPEYWNPPSLFDLAQCTGFDIESLIFCFGIGGGRGAVQREVCIAADKMTIQYDLIPFTAEQISDKLALTGAELGDGWVTPLEQGFINDQEEMRNG